MPRCLFFLPCMVGLVDENTKMPSIISVIDAISAELHLPAEEVVSPDTMISNNWTLAVALMSFPEEGGKKFELKLNTLFSDSSVSEGSIIDAFEMNGRIWRAFLNIQTFRVGIQGQQHSVMATRIR